MGMIYDKKSWHANAAAKCYNTKTLMPSPNTNVQDVFRLLIPCIVLCSLLLNPAAWDAAAAAAREARAPVLVVAAWVLETRA
jgi:hypothetical protein